jgi:hypothetical protein
MVNALLIQNGATRVSSSSSCGEVFNQIGDFLQRISSNIIELNIPGILTPGESKKIEIGAATSSLKFYGSYTLETSYEFQAMPIEDSDNLMLELEFLKVLMDRYKEAEVALESLKRKAMMDKITSFSTLPMNWNGYDGHPVPKDAVNIANRVLDETKYIPQAFPTGRESVQLEYLNGDFFTEIEIFSNKITMVCLRKGRLLYIHENLTESDLKKEIASFYEL